MLSTSEKGTPQSLKIIALCGRRKRSGASRVGAELRGAWTSKNNTFLHAHTCGNEVVSYRKRPPSQDPEALALANASGRLRVRNALRMDAKPHNLLLDDDWSLPGATTTSSKTPI